MERIKITIDSACDCDAENIKNNNIAVIPFNVLLGEKEYLDQVNISGNDIVKFFEEKSILPKTSAPSVVAYKQFFEEALKDSDYVIHFSISNELSVAHSNATMASKDFNGKVEVINSKSLSSGISLVMLYCLDAIKEGKSFKEVCEIAKILPNKTQASFVTDDLTMLYKGGRCSGVSFFFGSALHIKPSLLLKSGKIIPNKKYIGLKFSNVVKKYIADTLKQFPNVNKKRCFVTHTLTDSAIVQLVKEEASKIFDEVIESEAGATICSHCGRNTIGLLYVCNEEI